MSTFEIAPCTLQDAPAIARNNVIACWEDEHWAAMWTKVNKSRDYVLSQAASRWPYNLARDPLRRRHEKVVDVSTGELIGFANWILPKVNAAGEESEAVMQEIGELWPEARGPTTDDETLELLKTRFEAADWEYYRATDVTDSSDVDLKKRLRGEMRWLGE